MSDISKNKSWENGIHPVSMNEIDDFLKDFGEKLHLKLAQKGFQTFNSSQEVIGKLFEEFLEAQAESHNRDLKELQQEFLDCAIVSFWGYVSSKKWKKIEKSNIIKK